ncbi:hypothetical protein JCM15754A_12780 [Prevotella aurantiaca JCM 15754]|jgi:hypothetical protein|uniref:hypothetical protein n=1 Tax=Prevotella aurantiaca TaxID=596085 RepID=UPI000468E4ED|nr:hypothetical protein [Prevotella aurantiaca]MBF1385591.1 hypothetical protein [Prevotella aurantiaca]
MSPQGNKKPTYTKPVAICAGVLFFGSILLSILMATREMAPPRKYEVDMSGTVIGIDTTSKIPVLTKEEAKEVEVKENKKVDYVESNDANLNLKNIPEPEPIDVSATPPPSTKEETGTNNTQITDVKAPKIEPIE